VGAPTNPVPAEPPHRCDPEERPTRNPWWFPVPDDGMDERRALLDRAEQGDRRAPATLKGRYHVLYWGKATRAGDRTIVM